MNEKPAEYQHFIMYHKRTREILQIKIGPVPVRALDFDPLTKKAFKEKGKRFTDEWIIDKAWIGPEGSTPSKTK